MKHRENENDLCASLRIAIGFAENILAETDEQFRQLEAERTRLHEVISSLSSYLKDHSSSLESESEAAEDKTDTVAATNFKALRAWEQAQAVLDARKLAMTVPEIYEALLARGVNIAKDAIRVAMLRKPQIFRQAGNATYALMEWTAPEVSDWKLTLTQQVHALQQAEAIQHIEEAS
jgi:hypothetical protein